MTPARTTNIIQGFAIIVAGCLPIIGMIAVLAQ